MDATTRLARIEARCEVLGWKFTACHEHKPEDSDKIDLWPMDINAPSVVELIDLFIFHIGESAICFEPLNDEMLQAAERLLSCYEPGPVVKVSRPHQGGPCHSDCDLRYEESVRGEYDPYCAMDWAISDEPGPLCPGEGTFKLTPVEVDDER